jgi:arylsulfatase A-like enzyme
VTTARPNLLMIDCHDLGRHLACYGQHAVPSDAIDALAADGVRFTQAFCTAPQCSPSRASLYTGRHAHDVGMLGLAHAPFNWRLRPDARYLAGVLKDAGWSTHHVGVQHVAPDHPDEVAALGFDSHAASHAPAAAVADAATNVLEQHEGPFFLNIGFEEPHRDANGRFKDHPPYDARGVDIPPYLPDRPEVREEMAELQGAIYAMDQAVGRILRALRARNDANNTWVVFTTDHGLALPRAKATMYDPGLGVALIMRWPAAGLTGGRTLDRLTSHVDVVPTLLDGLGVPAPDGLHGRSAWSDLTDQGASDADMVFAEKTFHTAYEPMRAVRDGRYKLIANLEVDIMNVPGDTLRSPITASMVDEIAQERPPVELYDLQNDPGERVNLADDPAHAAVRARLTAALTAWMRDTHDPVLSGPVGSPYRTAALQALGLPGSEAEA